MGLERLSQIRDLQKYFDIKETLEMSVINTNMDILGENNDIMDLLEEYVKDFITKEDFSLDYIEGLLTKLKLYKGIDIQRDTNLTKMLINLLLNTIIMPDYLKKGQSEKNYIELKKIIDKQIQLFDKKIELQLGLYNLELGNINTLSDEMIENRKNGVNLLKPRRLYIGEGFGLNTFVYNEDINGYEIRIPVNLDNKINRSKRRINKDKLNEFIFEKLKSYGETYNGEFSIKFIPQNDISNVYGNGEGINYLTISISREVNYNDSNDVFIFLNNLIKINNFIINSITEKYGLNIDKRVKLFSNGSLLSFTDIKKQIDDQTVNILNLGNSQNEIDFDTLKITEKNPVSLKDVGGQKKAKEQIEIIIDMIKREHIYKKLGAKISKGILFEGPTGTGKTLLARVIATEVDAVVYNIKSTDIQSGSHLNEGAKNIKNLFKFLREKIAKSNKRIIVILDELDALFSKRGASINSSQEDTKVVNAFLSEQNGMDDLENIIFVGTTNRVDSIDPAILRRFENEVKVDLPDLADLIETYNIYIKKLPIDGGKLFEELKVEDLAKKTLGLSQSAVETIVNKLITKKAFESKDLEDIKNITLDDVDNIIKQLKKSEKSKSIGFTQ